MRRGSVLLAVLIVIVLGALIGSVMLFRAAGQVGAVRSEARDVQLRSLAWSGVQGLMAELADQRARVLRTGGGSGGASGDGVPEATVRWTVFEQDGERGVVRLVPLTEGNDGGSVSGAGVSSGWNGVGGTPTAADCIEGEATKLNVLVATPSMLETVVGKELAARIVQVREAKGDLDELLAGGATDARVRSSLDLLTTESYEPNTRVGVSVSSEVEEEDSSRWTLEGGWSADLRAEAVRVLGGDLTKRLDGAFKEKAGPRDLGEVVGWMRAGSVPLEQWGAVIDLVTAGTDLYVPGRVDVNSAPQAVLESIPGISEDAARRIVAVRAGLDDATKKNVAWPLNRGILSPEQFQTAVSWLSVRSAQWRARVEATIERTDGSTTSGPSVATRDRMVWEVVVDISEPRPRVASMRDVTWESVQFVVESSGEDSANGTGGPSVSESSVRDEGTAKAADSAPADAGVAVRAGRVDLDLAPKGGLANSAARSVSFDTLKFGTLSGGNPMQDNASNADAAGSSGEARALVDRRRGRWIGGASR